MLPGGGHTCEPSTIGRMETCKRKRTNRSHHLPTGGPHSAQAPASASPGISSRPQAPAMHSPRPTDTYHRSLCLLRQVWMSPVAAGGRRQSLSAAAWHHHWACPDSAAAAWLVGSLRRERWGTLRIRITGRAWWQGPAQGLKAGLRAVRPWVSPSASWASVAGSIRRAVSRT